MTLHIGVLGFLTTACYIMLFGFFVRTLTAKFPDSPISKALAFIY